MIWLPVKEASELLGYEKSTVRKKAKNGEYVYRYIPSSTGQGGRKIEISLESLPEEAQKAYYNQVNGDSQFVVNTNYTSTIEQKRKGDQRSAVLSGYKMFEKEARIRGMTRKGDILSEYLNQWNSEHPEFHVTVRQFYDWKKKKKSGKSLVDKRGGYNRGQSSIPKYYQEFFLSLYLQQSEPTLDACLRQTQNEANKNGDVIPGAKAFRNLIKNMDPSIIARARKGKKYFEDNFMPTMQRDYSKLLPNDLWVADHHLWDIFVRVPDGKGGWKPVRPWGSYWMDMRTRKVMSGFIRVESPNSDIVLLSFGIAVKAYGIPKKIYLDNGKDYKARDLFYPEGHMSEQDRQNQDIVQNGIAKGELLKSYNSLAANLQINVSYAQPYNARAKSIERLFNTLESGFAKFYPSYAGSDAKKRPEDLKDLDIMKMPTLEEFISHHKTYIEEIYNNSPHSGDSMDNKSPNYWYNSIKFSKITMSEEVLSFAFMRASSPRKVGKEGIMFRKNLYMDAKNHNFVGKDVFVRYDPVDLETIYIFDLDENFLFAATKRKKYGFELTEEDYAEANREKKLARSALLNGYKPNTEVRSTEAIGKRLEDYADSMDRVDVSEPKIIEVKRNEKLEEGIRRVHSSSIDRNYEDVLKREKERQRAVDESQKAYADKFKNKVLNRANETRKEPIGYEENDGGAYANIG